MNNEIFQSYLDKYKKDIDKACKYYSRYRLSKEQIRQSVYIAIWKVIDKHKSDLKMSFKSYLWNAIFWEINQEYNRCKPKYYIPIVKRVNINLSDFNDCLQSVPEKNRKVLSMYYLEGKTLQEIGKEIGKTAEMVRQYKLEGLKLFKRGWKND